MKLDLGPKYVDIIKKTILAEISNAEIFIFGSRTQGKALEYSVVDVALKSSDKIPIEIMLRLNARFKESTIPYKIDVVDLNNLKTEFKNIIEKDLFKI